MFIKDQIDWIERTQKHAPFYYWAIYWYICTIYKENKMEKAEMDMCMMHVAEEWLKLASHQQSMDLAMDQGPVPTKI